MDDITENTNPADVGEYIARVYRWNGHKIAAAFFAALTEANYHTERAALARTWARADELRNLIENEGNEDQAAAYLDELNQLKGA